MKFRCCSAWGLFLLVTGALPLFGQTITDFIPTVGTTNDTVLINTSGFPGSGTLTVKFNGTIDPTAFVGPGAGQFTARVPAGATTGLINVQRGASSANSSVAFTVIGRGPYITDYSPNVAGINDEDIVFNGVHLTNVTVIKFVTTNGTVNQTSIVPVASGYSMTAKVPVGTFPGTNTIVITNTGGSFTITNAILVIGAGPYISDFNPPSGGGGSQFFINGKHFTSATAVRVNNTNVQNFAVLGDGSIKATNRANVSTGFISVTGPAGSYTNATYFYIPPIIGTFSPTGGLAGSSVIITGQNFLGVTNVTFGGVKGGFIAPTNNTILQAFVSNGTPSGVIRVDTPSGSPALSATAFRIPPTLTGFAPFLGRTGTNVTISGANLNEGLATVKFAAANGTNGTNAVVVGTPTFSSVVVTVPPGAATGPITLTTSNGVVSTVSNFFLYASITSFTPTNGAPLSIVAISGQNLLGVTSVGFNGATVNVTPTNNSLLQVTVPDGAATGPISITSPTGTTNSGLQLFYLPPTITSFTPLQGLPGTNVTISGSNFLGTTAVTFNGVPASFTIPTSNTTLFVKVPTNNVFTGPITVTAPAGTATSSVPFTIAFTNDLAVSVSGVTEVFVGADLTYTIGVTNAGPSSAPNVILSNTLPAIPTWVTLKSATTTAGTINTNNNPITAALGTLGVSSSATITIVVVPQSAGTITNRATVSADYLDPVSANNTSFVVTTVLPVPILSIQLYTPTQVQISWPSALTNFGLQHNTILNSSTGWSNVGIPPFTVGDQKFIIDTINPGAKFYRLKR